MSLTELINRPCTVISRSGPGTVDELGNEIPTESSAETVCEAQPTKIAEPERAGEVSDEDWTAFFLPADAPKLTTASAVYIDGLGEFEVTGRPPLMRNPRTQTDSFVHVRMRQVAGAEDGS